MTNQEIEQLAEKEFPSGHYDIIPKESDLLKRKAFIAGYRAALQSIPKEDKPTPHINESDLKYFNKKQ